MSDTPTPAIAAPPAGGDTEALVALALAARARAYAPYSGFAVGAALRTDDGRVFTGANVENASYGLALCAERSAVAAAINAGARRIVELVVATAGSPPASPCGLCRQTLAEFADELPITLVSASGERDRTTLAELLPRAFRGDAIERGRRG